jgi:hypothetical protein
MKSQFKALFVVLFLLATPFLVSAQANEPIIKVLGEVVTPLNITIDDFKAYSQIKLKHKDKEGKEHTYFGVVLADILQKAGVTLGENLKGKNLTKFLLAEAIDGYQVVFSLAELDKAYTDKLIILANQVDGKPLATTEGPYRIIIQDEKKPSRLIRQVTVLRIGFAK